ncbi:hypothetical protein HBZS_117720 [Helicobacter bizzozeronii CCUG 35545]|nr:hypothetical protein HBZS_117720 [Helicobacter bizzozeronii CCUG 35545]
MRGVFILPSKNLKSVIAFELVCLWNLSQHVAQWHQWLPPAQQGEGGF